MWFGLITLTYSENRTTNWTTNKHHVVIPNMLTQIPKVPFPKMSLTLACSSMLIPLTKLQYMNIQRLLLTSQWNINFSRHWPTFCHSMLSTHWVNTVTNVLIVMLQHSRWTRLRCDSLKLPREEYITHRDKLSDFNNMQCKPLSYNHHWRHLLNTQK